ncbi:hypothetical protein ElyMa_002394000 [Elysia marginata]|uniref:Secreted protein n=1 Tax=Elysia marginata TaxID=1093978 RepID=A0AAV4GES7_9GAST|nr:hypothetical protein ElyMa_002394000 [Elysia marginata]
MIPLSGDLGSSRSSLSLRLWLCLTCLRACGSNQGGQISSTWGASRPVSTLSSLSEPQSSTPLMTAPKPSCPGFSPFVLPGRGGNFGYRDTTRLSWLEMED